MAAPMHAGLDSDGKNVQGVSSPMHCLVLRLCPGQEIVTCLKQLVKDNHLQAAFIITCVGSVTNAKLRMADSTTIKIYTGHYEIVSLVGTLSDEGFHLHGSFSTPEGEVIGGHVVGDLIVYTTAEIVVGECSRLRFGRDYDDKTGYDELSINTRRSEIN